MATKKLKSSSAYKKQSSRNQNTSLPKPQGSIVSSKRTATASWRINTAIFVLLVIFTAALYSSDLHVGFFSIDDEGYVIKNPWITSASLKNILHIFLTPYFFNYSPVHLFSYMLDYAVAGIDAYGFHLSSNLWAGVVAGFVFLVALALTKKRLIAVLASILFVVHPAHVEAVVWISSRKDLVATAFVLPSLLAYLQYRKTLLKKWYLFSLALFILALAGKLSVATFPAVFLAIDLFIEKRPLLRSLTDKIPFLAVAAAMALIVAQAQPQTGHHFSIFVIAASLLQSLWLLTGFGEYVLFRLRPENTNVLFELASFILMLIIFAAPLLLRKRFPFVTVMLYWILFALLPAQILSFVHPVTDRYLFFPSVASVILIVWSFAILFEKRIKKPQFTTISLCIILALFWSKATINYLSEWADPRSVFFASLEKSSDPDIPYGLGEHYMNLAARLGTTPRGKRLSTDEAEKIATAVWRDDNRLSKLFNEWSKGLQGGSAEKEFQNYLWDIALKNFEVADNTRGSHVLPNLYYKRGVLLMDRGDLASSKKEFIKALREDSLSTVEALQKELIVNTHNALGAIAWKENNYREALKWFSLVEEEQEEYGETYVDDIAQKIAQMQATLSLLSGRPNSSTDPEVAFNLGVYYLDASDQLGMSPRIKFSLENSARTLEEVWKADPQLQSLKNEWTNSIHSSETEKTYQAYLRKLAADAFDRALKNKSNRVMASLYFRRGMLFGETGEFDRSKKEFENALKEASKESNPNTEHEVTVLSYDALGVLAWTTKNYKEAANWFKLGEEEQNKFGGSWSPDISKKRQQMEQMSASAH